MRYIITICVLLAGCATATPIRNGTNQAEYFLECNGLAVPWSKCFAKANEVCPRGYEILEQATENGPVSGGAAGGVVAVGSAQYKHLRIKCT
jgi:hypothetical protein